MTRLSLLALVGLVFLVSTGSPSLGQDMATTALDTMTRSGRIEADEADAAADDGRLTYDDITVKAYTVTIFGGYFSGGTFLELPPIDNDRTYVEQGSDVVWGYDGEPLPLDPELYDGPIKKIDPGSSIGGKLGVYLSDDFHIDLTASYSQARAITTVRNKRDRSSTYREEVDSDDGFSVILGGIDLVYDGNDFRIFGMRPFVGFGIGGVINSFSALDDATGLYFRGVGGLNVDLFSNLSLLGQVQVSTFSFSRQELEYSKQVTYGQAFVGLSYVIDVLPPEIRAAHEAEQE